MQTQPTFVDSALTLIRAIGKEELLDYFWERLQKGKDLLSRADLIAAYARLRGAAALDFLRAVAADASESRESRIAALRGIRSLYGSVEALDITDSKPSTILELSSLLYDASEDIRSEVAIALVRLGSPQTVIRALTELGLPSLNVAADRELESFGTNLGSPYHEHLVSAHSIIKRPVELADIDKALRAHGIAVLVGPPGTGKTTLARQFTKMAKYDQKFWITCPRTDIDLARELALNLGLQRIGESTLEITDRLIGALKSSNVLIVVDDYERAGDDLARYISRLAAVTAANFLLVGRPPSWASGVPVIDLGPMTEDQSRRLFHALLPQSEKMLPQNIADQIVKRAEGNPLFLKLFVEQIQHSTDPQRSLGELLLPGALTTLLQTMMDGLAVEERRLLQIVSLFGGEIVSEKVAKDVFGQELVSSQERFSEVLGQLVRRGFIHFDKQKGIVFGHQIIREFVRSTIDPRTGARLNSDLAIYYDKIGDKRQAELHRKGAETTETP